MADDWLQTGFELADLLRRQDLIRNTAALLQVEVPLIGLELLVGLENRQPASFTQDLRLAGCLGENLVSFQRLDQQAAQSNRDLLDARRLAGGDEAQQPGCDLRQIGPADRQRTERVAQIARHIPDHARFCPGNAGFNSQHAGIAFRRPLARPALIDHRDAMTVALQVECRGDADDTGTDNDEMLSHDAKSPERTWPAACWAGGLKSSGQVM